MGGSPETLTVELEGRRLCVELAGQPGGRAVLICAGTPNSRHLSQVWSDDARARGIQLIGYDRPGYGDSDRQPGYRVADAAEHVQAIASALQIDRMAVWGFSGGGPYTLACAALLPELVVAAATVGSVAPYGAPGLDFFSGMGEKNVEAIELYFNDPDESRRRKEREREQDLKLTPEQLRESWKTLLSPTDARVLTGAWAHEVVRSLRDGLAPGIDGWWDDGVAHRSEWGFDLSSIHVPVKIWHGQHDRFVPFAHGQWLAEHVPGAERELNDRDGHLTVLVSGVGSVHEWLLSHF